MIYRLFLQCLFVKFILCTSQHPILIVVSYDAFRYNFFETKLLPLTEQLKKQGTYADFLYNVFPTKTFPNHHSIATGLFAETHGVIDNTFWDPKTKKKLHLDYEMYHYNDEIVPIWRHNEDLGNGRYSGTMMWPGAQFPYQNKNITYVQEFNTSMEWKDRVDMVMSWIENPKKPANLVMFYIEEPDTHAHTTGPNSTIVREILVKLDKTTQYLEDQIEKKNLKNKVHVIHVSDHGLVMVKGNQILNITQYLEYGTYERGGKSPLMLITPNDGYENDIYRALKEASDENEHFKIYKKEEYPERWHYKKNLRTPPLLIMAEKGYALDDLQEDIDSFLTPNNITVNDDSEFGVHGYDNQMDEMHGIFMARGPKIKVSHKVKPFNTVDLYNLFCKILDLPLIPNNGSLSNIEDILLVEDTSGNYTFSAVIVISIAVFVGIGLFFWKKKKYTGL